MKLENNSQKLISFFIKKKCINHQSHTKLTNNILNNIYQELDSAYNYIQFKIEKEGFPFFKPIISKINTISQIPKPKLFNANSFTLNIRNHIDHNSNYQLLYTFSLFNREINIQFIVEESNPELKINYYNKCVERMLLWLYFINDYASKNCAKKITIFIYLTSLCKKLPDTNITILDENHVNTAFTHTCPVNSEIVIFRKEEWFKVFMHETFHNFGLDFSDMNMNVVNECILDIFPLKSEVNLFEAYSEFWAEILNDCLCSYYLIEDKKNVNEFLSTCEILINFERTYSIFQMVKVLNFMGLTYTDLYSVDNEVLRNTLYKEKTNVLSYYVIKCILMNNYQSFFKWCNTHNLTLIQFKKTPANLNSFCEFIKIHYSKKQMLTEIEMMEKVLYNLNNQKSKKKEIKFLLNNMKMSICEIE